MAIIPMTSGFTLCPEGEHIFRIYKVEYKEDFGKLSIYLVNAQGDTHRENFSLMNNDGSANEKACAAFSFFAKTALNDFTIAEVDPQMLVDHYLKATVVHTTSPNKNDPSKTVTFANFNSEKSPANGFDVTPVPKALTLGKDTPVTIAPQTTPTAQETPATGLDLNALLNG